MVILQVVIQKYPTPQQHCNFVIRYFLLELGNVTCPPTWYIKYLKSYLFLWTTWMKQNGRDSQKREGKKKKKKRAAAALAHFTLQEVPRTKVTNNPRMTHKYL